MAGSRPPLVAKRRNGLGDFAIALEYVTTTVESFHQSEGLIAMIPVYAPGLVAATCIAKSPPNEWPASMVVRAVRYFARTIGRTSSAMKSSNAPAPPAVGNFFASLPVTGGVR